MLIKKQEISKADMEQLEKEMQDTNMNDVERIGKFRLKNQGGFVVKMDFVYYDSSMNKHRVDGSRKDITLGKSETASPGDYKVPEGALVSIHADVVWGKDTEGKSWFVFESGNAKTANFTISGTTLDNELGYNGITE